MAGTIDDVFKGIEQINTNLQQIQVTIDANLSALVQNATYSSQALEFIIKQNSAIICNLEHISTNTCGILNQAGEQTSLQQQIARATERMKGVLESVYAAEALNLERLDEMKRRAEECCKKDPPPPLCRRETCPDPGPAPTPPGRAMS